MSDDELLRQCVDTCRAMRKAYRGLIRRNVEALCRSLKIEDQAKVERMVAETIRILESP